MRECVRACMCMHACLYMRASMCTYEYTRTETDTHEDYAIFLRQGEKGTTSLLFNRLPTPSLEKLGTKTSIAECN